MQIFFEKSKKLVMFKIFSRKVETDMNYFLNLILQLFTLKLSYFKFPIKIVRFEELAFLIFKLSSLAVHRYRSEKLKTN